MPHPTGFPSPKVGFCGFGFACSFPAADTCLVLPGGVAFIYFAGVPQLLWGQSCFERLVAWGGEGKWSLPGAEWAPSFFFAFTFLIFVLRAYVFILFFFLFLLYNYFFLLFFSAQNARKKSVPQRPSKNWVPDPPPEGISLPPPQVKKEPLLTALSGVPPPPRAELTAQVAGPPESAAAHPIAHQLAQEWCREDAAGPAAEFTDEVCRRGTAGTGTQMGRLKQGGVPEVNPCGGWA